MSTIFPDGITFLKQYRKQPSVTGPSEAPTTGEGLHDEEWITMEPSWKEKLTAEASKIQDDLIMIKDNLAQVIARANRFDQLHGKIEVQKLEQDSRIEKQNSRIEKQDSKIEILKCSRSIIDSNLRNFYREMEARDEKRGVRSSRLDHTAKDLESKDKEREALLKNLNHTVKNLESNGAERGAKLNDLDHTVKDLESKDEEREALFKDLNHAVQDIKGDLKADINNLQNQIQSMELNIDKTTREFQGLDGQLNSEVRPQIQSHENKLARHTRGLEMSCSEIINHGYKISQLQEKLDTTTQELETTRQQFATLKTLSHTEAIATTAKIRALEAAHETQIKNAFTEQLDKRMKEILAEFLKQDSCRDQVVQYRLSHIEKGLNLYNTSLVTKKEMIDDHESRFEDLERRFYQIKPTEMYNLRLLTSLFAKKCQSDPNAPPAGTSKATMLQRHPALTARTRKFFMEAQPAEAGANHAAMELPKKMPVVPIACAILGMENGEARLAYGDVFKYAAGVEIDSGEVTKAIGCNVAFI